MSLSFGPVRARRYVDRTEVRRKIRDAVVRSRAEGQACTIFVHGIEGLGASALAVRVHDDDPEFFGQLIWVPARLPTGEPFPIGEMVRFILRRLGVAAADQESLLPDLLDEYGRVARSKRFMVVLDDVVDTQPVRELVPANAPAVVVLVTARHRMQSLVTAGFEDFRLEVLPSAESVELFRSLLGRTADQIDPAIVAELASFGGGIPFLLELLAGHVVGRPHVVARLTSDLRSSVSHLFRLDEEQRMPQWLDLAVARLSSEQSDEYSLLSLIPGSDFSVETAAAALGSDGDRAGRVLDDLVEVNLLVRNADDAEHLRYAFYSIVRADAETRTRDGGYDRTEVVRRVCNACLEQAGVHDMALSGRWRVGPVFVRLRELDTETRVTVTREKALAWFEREWLNVAACVQAARLAGLHEIATQLCVALFKYVHLNKLVDVWINVHNDGLDSARALDDQLAIMQLSNQRGAGHLEVGNYLAAHRDFEESLQAARTAQQQLGPGDPLLPMAVIGEQSALEWRGKVAAAQRDTTALVYYNDSWALLERVGDQVDPAQKERAFATLRLQRARFYVLFQGWTRAVAEIESAYGHFEGQSTEVENQAKCLVTWGEALLGARNALAALVKFERAADLRRQDSAGREYALVVEQVADAALAAGDDHRAAQEYRACLAILDKIGSPQADRVRTKLDLLVGADYEE